MIMVTRHHGNVLIVGGLADSCLLTESSTRESEAPPATADAASTPPSPEGDAATVPGAAGPTPSDLAAGLPERHP